MKKLYSTKKAALRSVKQFAEDELVPYSMMRTNSERSKWKQNTKHVVTVACQKLKEFCVRQNLLASDKKLSVSFLNSKSVKDAIKAAKMDS